MTHIENEHESVVVGCIPSKHVTLAQYRFNVGPPSMTVAERHWVSVTCLLGKLYRCVDILEYTSGLVFSYKLRYIVACTRTRAQMIYCITQW